MGTAGPLFGVIFYLLVLIAAISSAISLVEVVATFFLDRAAEKGKTASRHKVVLIVCLAITVEAILVAVDGLGSNGLWVPGQATFGIHTWNDCWLDFMDMMSEGIAMPLGALLMSLMVAFEVKNQNGAGRSPSLGSSAKIDLFYKICIYIVTPLGMFLVTPRPI